MTPHAPHRSRRRGPRLPPGVLLTLALAALPLAPAATASAAEPLAPAAAAADAVAWRGNLLAAVGAHRAALGLEPVTEVDPLDRAAQQHAEEMAAEGWFGFTSPSGVSVEARVEAAGFSATLVAAKVYRAPLADAPAALVDRWWKDDGSSRQSVFHGEVRAVGVGIATSASERFFVFVLATAAPTGPPPSLGATAQQRRAAFLAAANATRAARQLSPLREDAELDRAAQSYADEVLAALRAGRPPSSVANLSARITDERAASPPILAAGSTGGTVWYGARTPAKGGTKLRAGSIGETLVVDALSAALAVEVGAANGAPDLLAPGYTRLGVGMAFIGDGPPPHVVWVACLMRH